MAANVFEPAAQESTARKALGVALANADADTVARLATTCRVLRDDARCAPQLVFGPASKIWTATATGSAPNRPDPAVAGPADDILTAVVTRHRPGRLQRLVLCPPSDPRPTAPWARVAAAAASSRGALLPGTVQSVARCSRRCDASGPNRGAPTQPRRPHRRRAGCRARGQGRRAGARHARGVQRHSARARTAWDSSREISPGSPSAPRRTWRTTRCAPCCASARTSARSRSPTAANISRVSVGVRRMTRRRPRRRTRSSRCDWRGVPR